MTVIAWDGKTLAADRQCGNNGTIEAITKIWRVRGHLLAGDGSAYLAKAMLQWWTDGAKPKDYPTAMWEANEGCYFWIITPDGVLSEFSTKFPIGIAVDAQPMAIGSGRRCALAVMHMGGDARKAIEVTSAIDVDCGQGMDILTLDEASVRLVAGE